MSPILCMKCIWYLPLWWNTKIMCYTQILLVLCTSFTFIIRAWHVSPLNDSLLDKGPRWPNTQIHPHHSEVQGHTHAADKHPRTCSIMNTVSVYTSLIPDVENSFTSPRVSDRSFLRLNRVGDPAVMAVLFSGMIFLGWHSESQFKWKQWGWQMRAWEGEAKGDLGHSRVLICNNF